MGGIVTLHLISSFAYAIPFASAFEQYLLLAVIGVSLLWELAGIEGCFSLSSFHICIFRGLLKSFYFVGFVLYVRGSVF